VRTGARRAVFVDRDGTIVEERDYLADPAKVQLLPGVPEAIRCLQEAGFAVVLVTNQSGIARGLYAEDDYRAVQARVARLLRDRGIVLEATYYCPHHPDFTGPCDCRKPGPGMYRAAARELGLDLGRSWYVGDKVTDVLPALSFGGSGVLVRTGYGREEEGKVPPGVRAAEDLAEAVKLILAGTVAPPPDHVETPPLA
jgi:histidinol-phosphate phosphatase family protein